MSKCLSTKTAQVQIARQPLHPFQEICRANGIEHRLTKPNHPWTNGQVERMNRTLKEATVKRCRSTSNCLVPLRSARPRSALDTSIAEYKRTTTASARPCGHTHTTDFRGI
jgi:transposase InsO family protein